MSEGEAFAHVISSIMSPNDYRMNSQIVFDTLAEKSKAYTDAFLNSISEIINSKEYPPESKFFALFLLVKSTEMENDLLLQRIAKNKNLLDKLVKDCQCDSEKPIPERGMHFFSQSATKEEQIIGNNYVRLVLEAFKFWFTTYGTTDQNNIKHIYHVMYNALANRLSFPTDYCFVGKDHEITDKFHITEHQKLSQAPNINQNEFQNQVEVQKPVVCDSKDWNVLIPVCIASGDNYQANMRNVLALIEKNSAETDKAFIQTIGDIIFGENAPKERFYALLLFVQVTELRNATFFNVLVQDKNFFNKLYKQAQVARGRKATERGRTFFSENPTEPVRVLGNNYVTLLLEAIQMWYHDFAVTDKNDPYHVFHILYTKLSKDVEMPTQAQYTGRAIKLSRNHPEDISFAFKTADQITLLDNVQDANMDYMQHSTGYNQITPGGQVTSSSGKKAELAIQGIQEAKAQIRSFFEHNQEENKDLVDYLNYMITEYEQMIRNAENEIENLLTSPEAAPDAGKYFDKVFKENGIYEIVIKNYNLYSQKKSTYAQLRSNILSALPPEIITPLPSQTMPQEIPSSTTTTNIISNQPQAFSSTTNANIDARVASAKKDIPVQDDFFGVPSIQSSIEKKPVKSSQFGYESNQKEEVKTSNISSLKSSPYSTYPTQDYKVSTFQASATNSNYNSAIKKIEEPIIDKNGKQSTYSNLKIKIYKTLALDLEDDIDSAEEERKLRASKDYIETQKLIWRSNYKFKSGDLLDDKEEIKPEVTQTQNTETIENIETPREELEKMARMTEKTENFSSLKENRETVELMMGTELIKRAHRGTEQKLSRSNSRASNRGTTPERSVEMDLMQISKSIQKSKAKLDDLNKIGQSIQSSYKSIGKKPPMFKTMTDGFKDNDLERQLEKLKKENEALIRENQLLKSKSSVASLEKTIENLKQEKDELSAQLLQVMMENESLKSGGQADLVRENMELKAKVEALTKELNSLRSSKGSPDMKNKETSNLLLKLKELQKQNESLSSTLQELQYKNKTLSSKVEELEDLQNSVFHAPKEDNSIKRKAVNKTEMVMGSSQATNRGRLSGVKEFSSQERESLDSYSYSRPMNQQSYFPPKDAISLLSEFEKKPSPQTQFQMYREDRGVTPFDIGNKRNYSSNENDQLKDKNQQSYYQEMETGDEEKFQTPAEVSAEQEKSGYDVEWASQLQDSELRNVISNRKPDAIYKTIKGYRVESENPIFSDLLSNLRKSFYPNHLFTFKMACLKNKCPLYDNDVIQVGITSTVVHDHSYEKNLLKLVLYFGNKTPTAIQNFSSNYNDPANLTKTLKPSILNETIMGGKQTKQQLVLSFSKVPFECLQIGCSFLSNGQNMDFYLTLPNVITKFMEFKYVSVEDFRTKWKLKSSSLFRTDEIQLDPTIIKTPYDFKKYFGYLIDLKPMDEYEYVQGRKSIKLAGVFELDYPNLEYFLKISILPNNNCVFQVAGGNREMSQFILQTLIFLFRK